jgi:quinol monooxygenase YgiN
VTSEAGAPEAGPPEGRGPGAEHQVLVTRLVVGAAHVARATEVFRAMQAAVHAEEPGTVFYRYYQEAADPTVFWVHEVFADQAAKDFHLGNHRARRADFDAILAAPPEFHEVREL